MKIQNLLAQKIWIVKAAEGKFVPKSGNHIQKEHGVAH